MRAAFVYYLEQAWAADPHRQARRDAPARAAGGARPAGTPRRGYRARWLPGVMARRALTVLGGGSRVTAPVTWQPRLGAGRGPLPRPTAPPKGSAGSTLAADPPQPPDDMRPP
jgi:hypothetical protein